MTQSGHTPGGTAAAAIAVVFGLLLLLMGGGHFLAVTELARVEGRPFDFHFVSTVTMSAIIALPGLLSLMLVPWLRRAQGWAHAMVIAAAACLLGYLLLLAAMDKADPPKVGAELDMAIGAVVLYVLAQGGLWALAAARSARDPLAIRASAIRASAIRASAIRASGSPAEMRS